MNVLKVWIQLFQMIFYNWFVQLKFISNFKDLIIEWSHILLYDNDDGLVINWLFVLFP
jgi:hypothetical protein